VFALFLFLDTQTIGQEMKRENCGERKRGREE